MNRIDSEVRGAGLLGPVATLEYRALSPGQPLILTREPTNRADPNAVIVQTMLLQPCGYVAREHAAIIAPEMDRGILWLCKVTAAKHAMRYARIVLWKERGTARKFRDLAIMYGADRRLVDAIVEKRFLREDAQ